MEFTRESAEKHSITSYTDKDITIDEIVYNHSIIVGRSAIIPNWQISSILELTEEIIETILMQDPEVIIIGHALIQHQPPMQLVHNLYQKRIGIECMSIGAACRTFNVLLNEERAVVLGVIFSSHDVRV